MFKNLLLMTLLGASLQAQAFCGFFAGKADANLFNEASQVILVRDGPRTVISMLNDYKGPLDEFALVVPIPQVLEKSQVHIGDKHIFDRLDGYSAPRVAEYYDPDPCPVGLNYALERRKNEIMMDKATPMAIAPAPQSNQALGVKVEDSYTVGEYDIVMLSAKQSNGLETWLNQNGFKMPQGAAAALKPYVAQNMKFFVAKVNLKEQAATGSQYLRPLQFAFESEKFMLPIRLGMINAEPNKAQDLIIYALTKNGRVESQNYRTVKLPANENLPPSIKKDFNAFYKAMFDHQAQQADHRVVFTEYFWDMGWCDPCAEEPLSPEELQQAGVFWLEGDDAQAKPTRTMNRIRPRPTPSGGAQNALITRLHVRYTPQTFPEDLMFVQTKDRENWQTRYIVQNPFEGNLQQCRQKAAANSCERQCRGALEDIDTVMPRQNYYAACLQECRSSNRSAIEQARRYYDIDLPQRQAKERATLMRYTGWSKPQIDQWTTDGKVVSETTTAPATTSNKWWNKIFK